MSSRRRPIVVLLRIAVVLQCMGHARWMLDPRFGETPILSLLWGDPGLGGLGWSEATAQGVQQIAGWFFVSAALLTLARPCVYVLVPVSLVQSTIALAMWRMDIGFLPEWAASREVLRLGIPLASHALRIAAPMVLAIVDPWPGNGMTKRLVSRTSDVKTDRLQDSPLAMRWRVAEIAMRWAVALTFVGHGLKALSGSFEFQNLVALSAQSWMRWSPSQASLEHVVRAIGTMDLVTAALLVTIRWRAVAWWMAFWGLVTAASRITYSGWAAGHHQAFLRAAHAGVPAALALYWTWRKKTASGSLRNRANGNRLNMNKTSYLIAILVGSLGLQATDLFAAAPLEGTKPAQWRVIWKTDPATRATISWSTAEPGATHQVHLRADGKDSPQLVACQRNGRFSARKESLNLYYHHARLEGLKPGTKYHVTLESDGNKSPELYFVTAPAEDKPLSILFGGDSRSDWGTRQKVNELIRSLVTEAASADRPPIVAFAHGGDFVNRGYNVEQWSAWMSDYEITTTEDGRMLPIIPTRGNHDVGDPFNEVFDFPPEDKNYYALSVGPQIRFLTLNSETAAGGDQQRWLEQELAASRKTHRWLIAQYHSPAYPAVKIPSPAYFFWVPLFERYDADLICEADGHCIKRTAPIRNHKIDPTGVVYIGEGGLGVGQRTPKTDRWYLNTPLAKCGRDHHVQLLTFSKERLTYRAVLLDRRIFDEHHFAPRVLKK